MLPELTETIRHEHSATLDTFGNRHQAAVRFGKQSELHVVLAGKALLSLRRSMRPRE